MDRLENPVLRRELKAKIRIAKVIPAMILRCACLGLIFLLVLLSRMGSGILAFILAETLFIMLFTPGVVCDAFASKSGRGELRDLSLTRLSSISILLGKLAGASLYTCIIVLLSALVMCTVSLFHGSLSFRFVWRLVCANMALLILVFASAVISLAFSVLYSFRFSFRFSRVRGTRSIFAPAMLAYILIFLLIGSVVIPGPLIEHIRGVKAKAVVIKVALYANPLIMTSRALGKVDIMRPEYMYKLAHPIVSRILTYPDWYYAGIIYLGISCFLLVPVFIGFRRFILFPL